MPGVHKTGRFDGVGYKKKKKGTQGCHFRGQCGKRTLAEEKSRGSQLQGTWNFVGNGVKVSFGL